MTRTQTSLRRARLNGARIILGRATGFVVRGLGPRIEPGRYSRVHANSKVMAVTRHGERPSIVESRGSTLGRGFIRRLRWIEPAPLVVHVDLDDFLNGQAAHQTRGEIDPTTSPRRLRSRCATLHL
jgi:hypothetical protein